MDPTGEVFWFVAPAIGAAIGGGIDLGLQYLLGDGCIEVGQVALSAGLGAVSGGVLSTGAKVAGRAKGMANAAGKSARTPVGRSGQQNNFPNINAPKPRNSPETINGRDYSGHAIDRMQERGYTPSVIENALQNGTHSVGNKPNTSLYTDTANKLRVVTNSKTGNVVTVIPGLK